MPDVAILSATLIVPDGTESIPAARPSDSKAYRINPPVSSSSTPLMDGTAAAGTGTAWARSDHVHPVDTSRYAASNPSSFVTAAQAAQAAPVQSVAAKAGAVTLAHGDITDWTSTLQPYALTVNVPVASSTTPTMAGTAAIGTGTTWARADHVHPVDTSRYAASNPSGFQTAAQVTAVLPVAATTAPLVAADAAAVGTGTTWARADHVHPMRLGVTDGSNATAGQIGEFLSAQLLSTAAITLTSAVDASIVTLALTAGDWDVWGSVGFNLASNNMNTVLKGWINPTGGAAAPSIDQMGGQVTASATTAVAQPLLPLTPMRISVAAGVTIRLGVSATFSNSAAGWGKLMARRRR